MAVAGAATRLSARDWVQAALDVLVEEGIAGVRIPRLCERLEVTKGSFYWHFPDLDAFLDAVAAAWAEEATRLPEEAAPGGSGEGQLLAAMQRFADPRNRTLARAMRDWAQHDLRARAAVAAVDATVFGALREALEGLGFDRDEAEVRAKVLYYTGVGYAHVGPLGRQDTAEAQLRATWALLAGRP